jgi:hypothetical protein
MIFEVCCQIQKIGVKNKYIEIKVFSLVGGTIDICDMKEIFISQDEKFKIYHLVFIYSCTTFIAMRLF